jgi:hypothetical protein
VDYGFGNSINWTLSVVTTIIHFTTLQHKNQILYLLSSVFPTAFPGRRIFTSVFLATLISGLRNSLPLRARVTLGLAVYRQSVRLGAEPLETHGQCFLSIEHLRSQSLHNVFSDERMGLSFIIATGPRQRIHSRVRVPWDWRLYSTDSDSRLPFSSPPKVEVFNPASTRSVRSSLFFDSRTL